MFFWPHFVYRNKQKTTYVLYLCSLFPKHIPLASQSSSSLCLLNTDLSFPPSKASLTSTLTSSRSLWAKSTVSKSQRLSFHTVVHWYRDVTTVCLGVLYAQPHCCPQEQGSQSLREQ